MNFVYILETKSLRFNNSTKKHKNYKKNIRKNLDSEPGPPQEQNIVP